MIEVNDSVIGRLVYEYGWCRNYTLTIFGVATSTRLTVPCDEGVDIEASQREAFAQFDARKDDLTLIAEEAIFHHYQDGCIEYRERLGDLADELAPVISEKTEIQKLLTLTGVVVQQSFGANERIVGLLFDCSWEPDLGLAVKFVNESIDEVGPQDIVL